MDDATHRSCVIGTAGHVDHGKTSLVRALTGIDTDRLAEEKKRGLSIDLGFANIDFPPSGGALALTAAIVDVPGHERFLRNMLAGVTGIDMALFVVAADDGIMPQTMEHFDIVRLLGVEKAVFAVTKTDLVSPARVRDVAKDIERLASGTAFAGAPVVRVSTLAGEGLDELREILKTVALSCRRQRQGAFFRLPVDRSFIVKGFGTVVTGTVASGAVKKGDELVVFPTGVRVKARGIQSHMRSTTEAVAGERAAVNLSGVTHRDMVRGHVLTSMELLPFSQNASTGRPSVADVIIEPAGGADAAVFRKRRLFKVHHMAGESLASIRAVRVEGGSWRG